MRANCSLVFHKTIELWLTLYIFRGWRNRKYLGIIGNILKYRLIFLIIVPVIVLAVLYFYQKYESEIIQLFNDE